MSPGRPNKAIVDRDIKPENVIVTVTWRSVRDPRRLRRVAEILRTVLDRQVTPGESGQP